MISVQQVEFFHNKLIDRFGGSKGIRDLVGLESAINRPFATFDLQDLYPSPLEKASAIFESLIINHPFIDGNKRIAITMAGIILSDNSIKISAAEEDIYSFVISASMGQIRFDGILDWFKFHTSPTR